MARLFILGAGFSRPAGLPLANELLDLAIAEVEQVFDKSTHLHAALDQYRSFLRETDGIESDAIDVEAFAEFLDYQHFLGLLGSDTWGADGNRDQCLLRWGIGRAIHQATPHDPPSLYLDFAALLEPDDVVVSFNYDLLIEKSLTALDKPFRRFPTRHAEVHMMHTVTDAEAEKGEILITKLHGSVDWVSRLSFDQTQDLFRRWGQPDVADHSRESDAIFGPNPITPVSPLVQGPRPEDDPLTWVEQIEDLESYYGNRSIAVHHPPLLLPPSRAKQLYGLPLKPFWEGMGRLGWAWGGVNIIGYSLPSDDIYAKRVLWELVQGYKMALEDADWRIQDVNRITVVDLRVNRQDREQLSEAYRFLPTDHTDFITTGFDSDSLEHLFPREPYAKRRDPGGNTALAPVDDIHPSEVAIEPDQA